MGTVQLFMCFLELQELRWLFRRCGEAMGSVQNAGKLWGQSTHSNIFEFSIQLVAPCGV